MEILIILLLILLNGFLSMSEIALVSSRKSRLEADAKKGNLPARRVLRMSEKPERFLSTIQIGITLIGILTGLYSGEALGADFAGFLSKWPLLAPIASGLSKTIIVVVVTYITLIFGELLPKRIGMSAAEKTSKIIVGPMELLSKIAAPFVWILSVSTQGLMRLFHISPSEDGRVTEEEIKAIIQVGTDGGEIKEVEQDIVERVFTLGDRNVGSIMTHRSELVWLDISRDNQYTSDLIKQNLFNVYPVADSELDELLGVVFLKDLFLQIDQPDFNLRELVHPALYLPENLNVYRALEQIKQAYVKYGLVTDEFGEIQGIVTLKDIMTALIGSVPEENEEQEIIEREEGGWLVDGQTSFYDFLAHFDLEDYYAEFNYNTISGLILSLLEHIPKEGEKLHWKGFGFEIVDMDGARIDKIIVEQEGDLALKLEESKEIGDKNKEEND
ncbi:MAG: hemolysin family protein [Bacteroidales bacterium]|nr:hemolysin family protein [Bacteroidales bacterium]